jgi:hypothetical protein
MQSPPNKFHTNPPIASKVIKVFLYCHLRSLKVHFAMAEATRLTNVASRSSSMAAPTYQIS